MARRAPASTKDHLLEAAEHCFAAHGLEATKVEQITAEAGIAKGAFYSYFESKEECWRQIVERFLAKLKAAVELHEAAVTASRAPLPARLELWLEHDLRVFEFCWENRTMLHMLTNGSGGTAYAHLLDEFYRRCETNMEAMVRELMSQRVYRADVDPALVACMLGGAYDRFVRELVRSDERPDLAKKARAAQRMVMLGLLTDDARAQLATAPSSPHSAVSLAARRTAQRRPRAVTSPRKQPRRSHA
jgi:AcrR family transcriptional regulator